MDAKFEIQSPSGRWDVAGKVDYVEGALIITVEDPLMSAVLRSTNTTCRVVV